MTTVPALPALPDTPRDPWPGSERRLRGRDVFVRTGGTPDGEPAVLVHGLGGASTNWTDLMELLAGELDMSAPDLPGFGRSAPSAHGRYPLDLHVAAVAALIEQLGRGPVHLFGNSLGGAVSTRLAAERPDLVRSLTLVSPALPDLAPRRGLDPRLPLLFLPGVGGLLQRRLAAQPAEKRAQATLDLVYYDPSRVHPRRLREAADEVTRRAALGHAETAFTGSLRGLVRAQVTRGDRALWRQAAAVAVPVLLVWGRHDRLVDVRVSARASRVFRDARLLVLEDAGHVAQLEDPRAVATAWLQWRAERVAGG